MKVQDTYTWQMMSAIVDCHKNEGGDKDSLVSLLIGAAAASVEKYGFQEELDELLKLVNSNNVADEAQFILSLIKIISIDTYKEFTDAQKSHWDSMIRKAEIEIAMLRN